MTNSQPSSYKPSPKQQRYLRDLAERCGESFTPPRTPADMDREIKRLKGRRKLSASDRRGERRYLAGAVPARSGDGAAVRDWELEGYGSTAGWSTEVEDD